MLIVKTVSGSTYVLPYCPETGDYTLIRVNKEVPLLTRGGTVTDEVALTGVARLDYGWVDGDWINDFPKEGESWVVNGRHPVNGKHGTVHTTLVARVINTDEWCRRVGKEYTHLCVTCITELARRGKWDILQYVRLGDPHDHMQGCDTCWEASRLHIEAALD